MPGRLLVVLLAPVAAVRFGITPDFAVPRAAVSCYGGGGGGSRRGRGRDGAKSAAGRALLTRLEALPSTKAVPVDTIALHRIIRSVDHGLGGSLLTNVLSALKRKNRWQLAIAIGKLLEGPIAPSAQRRGRQHDDMCSRNNGEEQRFNLDSALAPPLETIHYNVLIGCCARPREWREALALLERMRKRGVPRETITYNSILDVMKKAGRWKLALRLLREMRAEKVPPNTITFSSAISACAQAGEWQRALQLLAYMRESGVMPNTITYSAAIAACERAGKWERAMLVFKEMKEENVEPDLIIFNSLIGALAKAGEWERATTLLEQDGEAMFLQMNHNFILMDILLLNLTPHSSNGP